MRGRDNPSSLYLATQVPLSIMYVVYDDYPSPTLMMYHIEATDIQRPRFS